MLGGRRIVIRRDPPSKARVFRTRASVQARAVFSDTRSVHEYEQGANRREGTQTLWAEGAGRWNSRVNQTCRAGMCRRGRKPMSAVCIGGPTSNDVGAMNTPAAEVVGALSIGSNRWRREGARDERLQGRAKRQAAAPQRATLVQSLPRLEQKCWGNGRSGRPQDGSNRGEGAWNQIRATGCVSYPTVHAVGVGRSGEAQANVEEGRPSRGNVRSPGL
jgi:hypothetical protein